MHLRYVFAVALATAAPPVVNFAASTELVRFGASGPHLVYVVIGDSTAAGIGSNESGIAESTARELARRFQVTMTNLGISGARMNDVLQHQLAAAERMRPDAVLLSAGANDVTHLTPIRSMRADLREIVQRLKKANAGVKIVITGSPDMGSPPRVPRFLRGLASCRTKQVNEMFEAQANQHALVFAPIAKRTGPLFRRDPSLFADDRFHPNDRGYATWLPVLHEALARALGVGADGWR